MRPISPEVQQCLKKKYKKQNNELYRETLFVEFTKTSLTLYVYTCVMSWFL